MTTKQLSFPLPRSASYAAQDFYPGPATATARAMLARRDRWPNGKLIVTGEAGSGKTHLLHIWATEHGAEVLTGDIPTRSETPLAIDGVNRIAGNAHAEEALFHLHNNMASAGLSLLISARAAPQHWGIRLPDLRSRMEATTIAPIEPADDATLSAIVLKQMSDRQLSPAPNVVPYLVRAMDRSYAEAARVVDALDTLALAEGRNITRALASRVLAQT